MAKITNIIDKNGEHLLPTTTTDAVYDNNNESPLSTLLERMQAAITAGGVSFTTAQMNAINSGITAAFVGELARLGNLRIHFANDTLTIFDAAAGISKSYTLSNGVTYTYGTPTLSFTYPTTVGVHGDTIGLTTFAVTQVVTGSDESTNTLSYTSLADFLAAGGTIGFTVVSDYDTFDVDETTGAVTVDANDSTSEKTATVAITITLHGKTASLDSAVITQEGAAPAGDGDVTITLGYYDGSNSSMGSITGDGAVNAGSTCTVTATPSTGYRFVGWYSSRTGTTAISTNSTYSFAPTVNTVLYAKFAESSSGDTTVTFEDLGGYTFTSDEPQLAESTTYHTYYAQIPAGYGMIINSNSSLTPDSVNSNKTQFNIGVLDSVPAAGKSVTQLISNWRLGKVRYFVPPANTDRWVVVKRNPEGGFTNVEANLIKIASTVAVNTSTEVGTVTHSSSEGVYINDSHIYSVTYTNFDVKYLLVEANTITDIALTGKLAAKSSTNTSKVLRLGASIPVDANNDDVPDAPKLEDATIAEDYVSNPVCKGSKIGTATVNFTFPARSYARYILICGDFTAANANDDAWTTITATKYVVE